MSRADKAITAGLLAYAGFVVYLAAQLVVFIAGLPK